VIAQLGRYAAPLLAAMHARTFPRPWSEADFDKLLANPATVALVSRDETPNGFALIWVAAGDAELLTVSVLPMARRQGIGAALVQAAARAAQARGAATLHLDVAADNAVALALYAKLGFAEVGRRKGYYAELDGPMDAIVMRKVLAEPAP